MPLQPGIAGTGLVPSPCRRDPPSQGLEPLPPHGQATAAPHHEML